MLRRVISFSFSFSFFWPSIPQNFTVPLLFMLLHGLQDKKAPFRVFKSDLGTVLQSVQLEGFKALDDGAQLATARRWASKAVQGTCGVTDFGEGDACMAHHTKGSWEKHRKGLGGRKVALVTIGTRSWYSLRTLANSST